MNVKHSFPAFILVAVAVQPVSAACIGGLLQYYLKYPQRTTAPGTALSNCQLALVRVVAVHPDGRPRTPWQETGTLRLSKIESVGKFLPMNFTVRYEKRTGAVMVDCQTWDNVTPETNMRLLAFFRPESKGWAIPELPAFGVVNDVAQMDPTLRSKVQRLFRMRL